MLILPPDNYNLFQLSTKRKGAESDMALPFHLCDFSNIPVNSILKISCDIRFESQLRSIEPGL